MSSVVLHGGISTNDFDSLVLLKYPDVAWQIPDWFCLSTTITSEKRLTGTRTKPIWSLPSHVRVFRRTQICTGSNDLEPFLFVSYEKGAQHFSFSEGFQLLCKIFRDQRILKMPPQRVLEMVLVVVQIGTRIQIRTDTHACFMVLILL